MLPVSVFVFYHVRGRPVEIPWNGCLRSVCLQHEGLWNVCLLSGMFAECLFVEGLFVEGCLLSG
jgi:hypothetical protein